MEREFINTFLLNLYNANIMRKEEVARFKSKNKDYLIELTREPAQLWYTDTSFKFLCKLSFKNNLGIEVLKLVFNENDIYILIDNLNSFYNLKIDEITIPALISNGNSYTFIFNKVNDNNNSCIMRIIENDCINRVTIEFDINSFLDFVDLMFFTFIVDIDIYSPINDIL